MHVLLTGGTGHVGSAVLKALLAEGHEVTALVRSDDSAAAVRDAGATPLVGDIADVAWLSARLTEVDGAIHTASPGDKTSADVDRAVATAVATAFAGTGRPYVHTSGVWVYGAGAGITESTPFSPPALTAWREDVEKIALGTQGARVAVVAPGIVYGHGKGIPNLVASAPRTDAGALTLVGSGTQHWTTVHADDLADLYVRVLTDGASGAYYIGASGQNPSVRELGAAASRAGGGDGTVEPESDDATRGRLGTPFADALLLDQQVTTTRGHTELGWTPSRPSLVEDLEHGSYAPQK